MTQMNFPDSPTVGQQWPSPPLTGMPVYTWDGTRWTIPRDGVIGSKFAILNDGSIPMAAQLTLAGDPVAPTDAADKNYVDTTLATFSPIPSGTRMVFYQSSAPTGWTIVSTENDKVLRVVSSGGGVSGGTNPFSTVNAAATTGNTTLTAAQIPAIASSGGNTITGYPAGSSSYTFPINTTGWSYPGVNSGVSYYGPFSSTIGTYTSFTQFPQTISVNSTNAGGTAHSHPLTLAMQYVDVIIASKN